MKNILALILSIAFVDATAQTFKVSLTKNIAALHLVEVAGSVEVIGIAEEELRITTITAPKDASPRSNVDTDNTQHGMNYKSEGNKLTITGTRNEDASGQYKIEVPFRLLLSVQGDEKYTKALLIQKMKGKMDVQTNADVTITDLSSGLVLQTGKGKVLISIEEKISEPVSVITQSGDVTLHFPEKLGVDLQLGTGTGHVLGLLKSRSGSTTINATQFSSPINGGGTKIQIRSVSGNILISNSKKR